MIMQSERRPSRALWWVIGAVVLVLVLATGGLIGWLLLADGHVQRETQTASYDRPISSVVFDGIASGDVSVHGREGVQGVTVRRSLHWNQTRPTVRESWSGDVLTVTVNCPDWGFGLDCGIDYDVDVPVGTAIDAELTSGDVSISGITGSVRARTSSGDIRLTEVGGDTASVNTTSGDVIGDRLAMRSLTAESTSGDLRLTYAAAPLVVKATATSGDVVVTMPRGDITYRVRIDTTSGDQSSDFGNNDSGTGEITITATSGDVRVRAA